MTTLNHVRVALENHLNTTSPALPAIAWPNVPYTPSEGTPYIRARLLPINRRPVVMGPNPEQRLSGLFYLTVYTPENQGAGAGVTLVDQLLARFDGATSIVTANAMVRLEYAEAKSDLHEPPFYVIPIEIGWYAYSTP
jgi:hypothetical protein